MRHPEIKLKQMSQALLLVLASLGIGLPLVDLDQTKSIVSALRHPSQGCTEQENTSSDSPPVLALLSAGYNVDTQHHVPNHTEQLRILGLLQEFQRLQALGQRPELIILAVGKHTPDQNQLKLRNVIISMYRQYFDLRPNGDKEDLDKNMFVVVEADDTLESVIRVQEVLVENGITGPITIITSDLHQPRSQWLACNKGLPAQVLGAETLLGEETDYFPGHTLEAAKLALSIWLPDFIEELFTTY